MSNPLIIIGAGGFGRETAEYAADAIAEGWPYRLIGFADDASGHLNSNIAGLPHLGRTDDPSILTGQSCLIAIGDPATRQLLSSRLQSLGALLVTLVHPSAFLSSTALVDTGTIICPLAFIGPNARVGANAIVNIYASVGHDASVGRHSVLSPYATLNGNASVGECVFLGTRATLTPAISVGNNSKVTAGSTVTRSAPAGSLLTGSPAHGRVIFRSS